MLRLHLRSTEQKNKCSHAACLLLLIVQLVFSSCSYTVQNPACEMVLEIQAGLRATLPSHSEDITNSQKVSTGHAITTQFSSSLSNFFIFFPVLVSGSNKNHGIFWLHLFSSWRLFSSGTWVPSFNFFSPKLQLIVYGLMKTKKNLGNFAKYLCNLVSGFCKGYQMHLGWIQPGLGSSQWLSDGS